MNSMSYDELLAQNELLGRQLHDTMQKNRKLLVCVETLGRELEERDELIVALQEEYDKIKIVQDKTNFEVYIVFHSTVAVSMPSYSNCS